MSFKCPTCKHIYPAPSRPIRLVHSWRTTKEGERQIAGEHEVCLECAQRLDPENPEVIRRVEGERRKAMLPPPPSSEVSFTS
jgi:hypothetical protein